MIGSGYAPHKALSLLYCRAVYGWLLVKIIERVGFVFLQIALDLFDNDYFTDFYNTLGYYSYADFYEFGIRVGISHQRIETIIHPFMSRSDLVQQMIDNSLLPSSIKHFYWQQYQSRLAAID